MRSVEMNGTYGFVYCGYIGVGMGVFRIANSALVGVDLAGAKYRGQVVEDKSTGGMKIAFEMSVPSGVMLVQGTTPLDTPYTKTAEINAPPDFGDGTPFQVYIAPGTITMMVKRIPDDYSAFADGVRVNVQPIR
jgi:hypothetical protein